MGVKPCAWVTRPEGQVAGLAAHLDALGFEVRHWPLLAIEEINPLAGELRQRLIDLDCYQHIVFISANAARVGLARIEDYWPQLPAGQHYWAVGASTARVLAERGIDAGFPDQDMSSEGLLALAPLAELHGQKVLIVRGEGGRELLASSLQARGAQVDALPCYRRALVAYEACVCREAGSGEVPTLILISSGEGLAHLSDLLRPLEHTKLAASTLIVPSPRVAEQAMKLGWQRVECAANASDEAMVAAVQSWRRAHPGEIQY